MLNLIYDCQGLQSTPGQGQCLMSFSSILPVFFSTRMITTSLFCDPHISTDLERMVQMLNCGVSKTAILIPVRPLYGRSQLLLFWNVKSRKNVVCKEPSSSVSLAAPSCTAHVHILCSCVLTTLCLQHFKVLNTACLELAPASLPPPWPFSPHPHHKPPPCYSAS